jgi:phosphopantetheine adenylyltransferase
VDKAPDLSLDQVTINVFKNLDKETLFRTISEMEEKSINHLDAETIDSLSRLYQNVINVYWRKEKKKLICFFK